MRQQKSKSEDTKPKQELEGKKEKTVPIIASARTGLSGKDDALIKRVPVDYAGKTVNDLLTYLTSRELSSKEVQVAQSITNELSAQQSVILINGKNAELTDSIDKYFVLKEHNLPDGTKKQYQELEIEISAVHQGGYHGL